MIPWVRLCLFPILIRLTLLCVLSGPAAGYAGARPQAFAVYEMVLNTDILQAERALASLADDPQQLDRARRRFSASPPFHKSPIPGSTRSQSSTPPTPGQVQKRLELDERYKRQFSRPARQLSVQTGEQHRWFFRLFDAQREFKHRLPPDTDLWILAREIVKKRWREQGIWNSKWDKETNISNWRWKHEESETPLTGPKGNSSSPGQREKLERDREASRPFHQFVWQLARQRDLMTGKRPIRTAAMVASVDINTMAYEAVKELWDRMGIWDTEWGVMPGMTWMHERPPKWTPQADSIAAHAREHSFAVAEVEAEAQRLFPKQPSPVTVPGLTEATESFDYWDLFAAESCSHCVNDDANEGTSNAVLPNGHNITGTSDGVAELAKELPPLPTHPSLGVLEEPRPPIEDAGNDSCHPLDDDPEVQPHVARLNNYHPLDYDPEYQRQVARLMDPFNVLKRKKAPQDILLTSQSPQADTPHGLFQRSNIQEHGVHKGSISACDTEAAKHPSSDRRNTINTIGETEGPGGQRRSKRLPQEPAESNDHGRPPSNDQLPPPSKRIKRKPNLEANRVKEQGLEETRVSEPRRSSRRKEQKNHGAGGQTTRATAKSQGIAKTKPVGRRKGKAKGSDA